MIKKRIQSILMLLTFTIFAEAAGIEIIPPDKILSSTSTGAATPADLILDGDTGTAWQLAQGEQDGWAELGFDNAYLFYGIYIEGQINPGTTLNIEYSNNGIWTPFISGILFSLSSSRQLINLSYDMAVSKSIKLHLRGANASESFIKEVSVIGKLQADILHKIRPLEVKASDNTSDFYPSSNLFDRNTYTLWKSGWSMENRGWDYDEDDWNRCRELRENRWYGKRHKHERRFARHRDTEIEAECDLGSIYTLEKIRLFFDEDAKGDVKIEYEASGRWMQAAVIRDSSLIGWYEVSLSGMNISTSGIKITIEGRSKDVGGLGEVEIYGFGAYKGNNLTSLINEPVTGSLPINLEFTMEETKDTLVQFLYKENMQSPLAIEVNGKETLIEPKITIYGNTIYAETIPEEDLWEGMNFIRIKPQSIPTTLLAVKYGEDTKEDINIGRIGNGFITPADSHTIPFVINLGQKYLIKEVEIFSANPRGQSILANENGEWTVISPASYGTYDTTYSPEGIITDALTIGNPLAEPIENIRITGSPITNHAPEVRIIWPLDGDDVSERDIHTKKLLGFVDNPDTTIKVNDRRVKKIGHYFWTELDHLWIMKDNPATITAEATDELDRKGSHSITVYYGESPLFSLDQKDEIIYTSGATIKISGTVRLHDATVTVNDIQAKIRHNRFSVNIPLEMGLNIIKATCTPRQSSGQASKHGNFTRTILRKAVRLESDLSLNITSPQDQSYTNAATTTLSGVVEGIGKITVTVNGTQAVITGNTFESRPVTLAEGTNTITVVAKNQYGTVVTKQITITRDTSAPIISGIIPATGTIIPSNDVQVSLSAQDTSPIWVYANGKVATLSNGRYSAMLNFSDGTHTITVKAKDAAGNTATQSITIITDTTPPLPFTVTANPSGWTDNTQPIVIFETIDATSGVARYELAVDDLDFAIASSPHTLGPLPDGEHTVNVKAIDNAGWETLATTKVYIDTIAPFSPEAFELVPGNEQIRLNWKDLNTDIVAYRITRYLPWEETNVWAVNASDVLTADQNRTYIDLGLFNSIEYRYSIIAIDRAGNESESTVILASICGVEKEQNVAETEIIAKYEGATLYIQPGGLHAETAQVVIIQVESEEIDASMTYGRISPIFSFIQANAEGGTILDGSTLPKNFIGAIDYDPALLPEGYEENNIGVYYFNLLWDRWFLIEPTLIDKENNRAYFLSHHFTLYTVQPTAVQDLTAQEYKDAGYSPLKTYAQHESITVSPQGGSVYTGITELVLPGPAGFDLSIKRRYNTALATIDARIKTKLSERLAPYITSQGDFTYRMGDGWRLDLPYVMNANIDMYITIPGGGIYSITNLLRNESETIDRDDYKYLVLENHEDNHFKLIVELEKKTYTYTQTEQGKQYILTLTTWKGAKYTLTMADGTTYEMDGTGKTTKIRNPSGLNAIRIIYKTISVPFLSINIKLPYIEYIEDAIGRRVNVGYTTISGLPYINSFNVTNNTGAENSDPYSRTISYTIDDTTDSTLGKIKGTLRRALDSGEREWLYTYDPSIRMDGPIYPAPVDFEEALKHFQNSEELLKAWEDLESTAVNHPVPVLKTLRGPGKGIISIDYMVAGTSFDKQRWIVANNVSIYNQSENYASNRPVRVTDYNYIYSAFAKTQCSGTVEAYVSETREIDGERETVYNFDAIEKTKKRWSLEEQTATPTPIPVPVPSDIPTPNPFPWMPAITIQGETSLQTLSGTMEAATSPEPYMTYPPNYVAPTPQPQYSFGYRFIVEDGDPKSEVESRVTGVTRKAKGSDTALETITYTYPADDTTTTEDESKTREPEKARIAHGENYLEETYAYDSWGNVTERTTVSRAHDGTSERLNKVIVKQQYLGNGDALDETDPWKPYTSGLEFEIPILTKSRHKLPLMTMVRNFIPIDKSGNILADYTNLVDQYTYYEYNSIGQMKRKAQWDSSKEIGDEWLVTRFEYDNETTGVADFGNMTAKINPENHRTEYEYDSNGYMNKITEKDVHDADNNANDIVTESYFEPMSGWMAWHKNPRGFVSEYTYDSLGRIEKITHPDDDGDATNNPHIDIVYGDTAGNLFAEMMDEENRITTYKYNDLGQLSRITRYKGAGKTEPINIDFSYNRWGETASMTNPNGYTTLYQYDAMARQSKIIYPDDSPGTGDNPFKTFAYDYSLDKLTITDERGKQSFECYDMNNSLLSRIQPNVNVKGVSESIETYHYFDGLGNRVMTKGPRPGATTISTYNSLNQLERTTLPEDSFLEDPTQAQAVLIKPVVMYEYNRIGFKVKELTEAPDNEQRILEYKMDELGRTIVASNKNGSTTLNSYIYYFDEEGNIAATVDANNVLKAADERKTTTYTYSAMNRKLSETDNAGNATTYEYFRNGNIKKLTGPRGNSRNYTPDDFTLYYHYDNLGRLDHATLPAKIRNGDRETITFVYDDRGNLLEQINPDTSEDVYTYSPRGWIMTQTRKESGASGKSYTVTNAYDLNGNQVTTSDPLGNATIKEYDNLGRLIKTAKPEGGVEKYGYDEAGNRTFVIDGNGNETTTLFNNYNQIVKTQSPLSTSQNPSMQYFYDRLGNKTKEINANGHTRIYAYDKLNRLTDEIDEIGGVTHYVFDAMGNVTGTTDPNGTTGIYGYTENYLLSSIDLTNTTTSPATIKHIAYTYDEEGALKTTDDDGVIVKYNFDDAGTVYVPDAYNRIFSKQVTVDAKTLVTKYAYDKGDRIISVTYPNNKTVSYEYNTLGELTGMPGYINPTTIQYNGNGLLSTLTAANNIPNSFAYDRDSRLTNMTYGAVKQYDFTYDNADNIVKRNDNNYQYDSQNQLIGAYLKGQFGTDTDRMTKNVSIVSDDHFGSKAFEQTVSGTTLIELDYAAGSLGIDLGARYTIMKIELSPDAFPNRVDPEAIRIFTSDSDLIGSYEEKTGFTASYKEKDGKTVLEIIFTQQVTVQYIKIKTNYDDRALDFAPANKAEFKGNANSIVKVYYITASRDETYAIDATGNRTSVTVSTEGASGNTYRYYPNTDRLMTDGKNAYQYDPNGNTVKKCDYIVIDGIATQVEGVPTGYWETVTGNDASVIGLDISATDELYFEHRYDLLNRLVEVKKNGQTAATYVYDEAGLMVKKTVPSAPMVERNIYIAWAPNGKKLYEEKGTDYQQYVYMIGRLFACEKGMTDDSIAPTRIFVSTDQVGSVTAITDANGAKVWENEMSPFGMLADAENPPLDGMYVFGGHWYDAEAGLFYMWKRWYNVETGRFMTTDQIKHGLNRYIYCSNNPLRYFDPDGLLQTDSTGNYLSNPNPATNFATRGFAASFSQTFQAVQMIGVHIYAADGFPIEAFINTSSLTAYNTNCHGFTFADGKYWIDNNQVKSILSHDGYSLNSDQENPNVGDVVVYYNEKGEVVHSAKVISIDPNTHEVEVIGDKGTLIGGPFKDPVEDACPKGGEDGYTSFSYYSRNPAKYAGLGGYGPSSTPVSMPAQYGYTTESHPG